MREGRLRRAALTGVAACLALGTVLVPVALAGQVNEAGNPPGQLVEVEGRNIHVLCTGAGSPGVILEAGASFFAIDWTLVQREVERSTMARPVRARLFADYRQIQLREPNARGDLEEAWTAKASEGRIAAAGGIVAFGTEAADDVDVTLEVRGSVVGAGHDVERQRHVPDTVARVAETGERCRLLLRARHGDGCGHAEHHGHRVQGGLVLKPARSLPRCNPRVSRGQAERCTLRAHDRGDALAPCPHSDLTRLAPLVTCAPIRSGKAR